MIEFALALNMTCPFVCFFWTVPQSIRRRMWWNALLAFAAGVWSAGWSVHIWTR